MNSNVDKENFEKYLNEARSWETSKLKESNRSKRTAWTVASVATVLALVLGVAVSLLALKKEVEPFVIRVDNATGIVDVVEAMTDGETTYDEAVNKYFVQWYIRYREGYSNQLAEEYYNNVGIMSDGLEQQKYAAWFNPKNPLSPINVYGPYAKVKIRIKSTSFIKPDVALVRYTKEVERGLDAPQVTHWAATVTFRYSKARMSEKDRGISPLGFRVMEYRNDPDILHSESNPTPAKPQPPMPTASNGVTAFAGSGQAKSTVAPAPVVPAIQTQ
jgi:type IV secretion system protein VirB8